MSGWFVLCGCHSTGALAHCSISGDNADAEQDERVEPGQDEQSRTLAIYYARMCAGSPVRPGRCRPPSGQAAEPPTVYRTLVTVVGGGVVGSLNQGQQCLRRGRAAGQLAISGVFTDLGANHRNCT